MSESGLHDGDTIAARSAHRVPLSLRAPVVAPALRALTSRMDDLRLALAALTGHKLRSGLTLLGIVIGVFTVVSMMALLAGLQAKMEKSLCALRAHVLQLQKWPAFQFGELSPEVQRRKRITLAQLNALRDALPQARQVGGAVGG